MTAEILLMNKEAIALAADSAITLSTTGKVFNSGTKIFPLSEKQPVAIMVYGNTEFMGIPWETIIHLYRTHLGDAFKPSIEEYKQDFITFLEENPKFSSESDQKASIKNFAKQFISSFYDDLDNFKAYLKLANYKPKQIEKEIIKHIAKIKEEIEKQTLIKEVSDQFDIQLGNSYCDELIDAYNELMKEKDPEYSSDEDTAEAIEILEKMVMHDLCSSKISRYNSKIVSGIVITGFGPEDIFPSFHSFEVRMVALNKLIFRDDEPMVINREIDAAYSAFAQGGEALNLFYGVSKEVEEFTVNFLRKLPDFYDKFNQSNETEDSPPLNDLIEFSEYLITSYQDEYSDIIQEKKIDPLLSIIAILPKQELAFMVETLVSLASFSRRISPEPATIGGPINVALITKAEGFQWIKRNL